LESELRTAAQLHSSALLDASAQAERRYEERLETAMRARGTQHEDAMTRQRGLMKLDMDRREELFRSERKRY
jgi:hypothetical protein